MAYQQAERLAGWINSDLRVLKTLSNIMGDYENVPAGQRRDRFDDMLREVLINEKFVTLYTVWKPNALDGMDSRYIGRPGSSPTGQYATAYSRETGRIMAKTSEEIENSIAHINGPFSRNARVGNPAPLMVDGKETYVVDMMVPIVNGRINEVVGGVGFIWDVRVIQSVVEETVKSHEKIAAMAVYSGNGSIIGSIFPERIGRMLSDADITLYGDKIRPAYDAVIEGKYYNFRSFVPFLENDVEIIIVPFSIGIRYWEDAYNIRSGWRDTTWTVMIASPVKL
jgi:methyl-accepting chemotaxis protein